MVFLGVDDGEIGLKLDEGMCPDFFIILINEDVMMRSGFNDCGEDSFFSGIPSWSNLFCALSESSLAESFL